MFIATKGRKVRFRQFPVSQPIEFVAGEPHRFVFVENGETLNAVSAELLFEADETGVRSCYGAYVSDKEGNYRDAIVFSESGEGFLLSDPDLLKKTGGAIKRALPCGIKEL